MDTRDSNEDKNTDPTENIDSTEDANAAEDNEPAEDVDSAEDAFFQLTPQAFEGVATPPQSPSPVPADTLTLRIPKGKGKKRNMAAAQKQRSTSGRTVSAAYSTPPTSPVMAKADDKADDLEFDDDFARLPPSNFKSVSGCWNPYGTDPFSQDLMMATSGNQEDFSFLDNIN